MRFTRITVDANELGGVPCLRGSRLPVATVVSMFADGMSEAEILRDHPELERDDVREALRYAAAALNDRDLPLVKAGSGT
ncbi:MAG: DUF433 domain-containing protein [bacterium]